MERFSLLGNYPNIEIVFNIAMKMELLNEEFKKYNDVLYPEWSNMNSGQYNNEINIHTKAHIFFSEYNKKEKILFKKSKEIYSKYNDEIKKFIDDIELNEVDEIKNIISKWDILYDINLGV